MRIGLWATQGSGSSEDRSTTPLVSGPLGGKEERLTRTESIEVIVIVIVILLN